MSNLKIKILKIVNDIINNIYSCVCCKYKNSNIEEFPKISSQVSTPNAEMIRLSERL